MRALGLHEFGGPEVLEVVDLPAPGAGPGEVLVEVVAATVNPTDLLMRAGRQAASMTESSPPYLPGMEFSGHVTALGPGTAGPQPGTAVMGVVDPRRPAGGAYAQLLAVPAASVVPVPAGIDMAAAATVPMNGLTAALAVAEAAVPSGGTLLVTGAAGALGGYVIQLAGLAGCRVVADAREADRALLAALGADDVVPRDEGMAPAVKALVPQGVDAVVDAARIGQTAEDLVRDGGTYVGVRSGDGAGVGRVVRRTVSVLTQLTNTASLGALAEAVRAGSLMPRVARELPLSAAAEAHAVVERGGLRGRVVLRLGE